MGLFHALGLAVGATYRDHVIRHSDEQATPVGPRQNKPTLLACTAALGGVSWPVLVEVSTVLSGPGPSARTVLPHARLPTELQVARL